MTEQLHQCYQRSQIESAADCCCENEDTDAVQWISHILENKANKYGLEKTELELWVLSILKIF